MGKNLYRLVLFSLSSIVFLGAKNEAFCTMQSSATKSVLKQEPWTQSYRKVFSLKEKDAYKNRLQGVFERSRVIPFSQLIFSWNALRPTQGSLVFFAQVRDKKSHQWGPWHRMMSWGALQQKSHVDKNTRGKVSSYHFVRLELDKGLLADAFRIQVKSEGGASLSSLHSFVVAVANLNAFLPEKMSESIHLPSVLVEGVPTISQFLVDHPEADRLCSPTSCSMVASFLGKKSVNPTLFADKVYDKGLGVYGSWSFNTAQIFDELKGKASAAVVRMYSFKSLYDQLKKGFPVVVSVRGFLQGAPKSYDNGHLLVVVGWDAEHGEVICNDPAHKTYAEVRVQYGLRDFLTAWERSRRLAYLVEFEGQKL